MRGELLVDVERVLVYMCIVLDRQVGSIRGGIAINLQGESVCSRVGSYCLYSIAAYPWLLKTLVFVTTNLQGIAFA